MALKFRQGWQPVPSGRCMPTLGSYLGRKINKLIEETLLNTQAYKSQPTGIYHWVILWGSRNGDYGSFPSGGGVLSRQ